MDKAEIINKVAKDAKSYLEIGYQYGINFKQIKLPNKVGVDPKHECDFKGTSDEFFKQNDKTFDCVLIDGLHRCEQVRKDLINAMGCLSKEGVIFVHDTLPHDKSMTIVPRQQKVWTGDVYKAIVGFIKEYGDQIKIETYREKYGLTAIYPNGKKYRKKFVDNDITFDEFKENDEKLLNIVD